MGYDQDAPDNDLVVEVHLKHLERLVDQHGWAVQGVVPSKKGGTGFAYTVGLTMAGLPELVVSGSFNTDAQSLLNIAAPRHCAEEMKHGDTVELLPATELLQAVTLRIIRAPLAEVNMARALYGFDSVEAVQLVWPDDNGDFPPAVATTPPQVLFGVPWWV